MKTCPCCKTEKPETEYNKHARSSDGLQVYCRPCAREKGRASEARRKAGLIVKREVPDGYKFCPSCETAKPFDEFHEVKGKPNAYCKPCLYARQKDYRERNAEAVKARKREYREKNRERLLAKDRAYYEANKERINAQNKAYYEANKDRMLAWQKEYANHPDRIEKTRELRRAYKAANKHIVKAEYEKNKPAYFERAARRRATKKQATPAWADIEAIREYYRAARAFRKYGYDFHVDHIVPLKSPLVSGLHTEANLRLLPGAENLSKHNRFWPDMP